MRKTIFTALVTLLVMLAVVSCDSILGVPGSDKAVKYDADGRELVTLNITTSGALGNSRSLTNALAKEGADYMEVIFKGDPLYYRASGQFGGAIPISIQKKDYTTADAVMFIGKRSPTDYTLLAVGYLTGELKLKTGTAPTENKVAFTLTSSLTALLNVNAASPPGSAFEITESSWGTVSGWDEDGISKIGKVGSLPSFQVPKTTTATSIEAKLTIGGFPGITPPPALTVKSAPVVTFTENANETPVPVVGATSAVFAADNCTLSFTFDTTTASVGAYIITFKIPVALSTDTGDLGWFIRGGTLSGIADSNATGSKADGVLLSVQTTPNHELFEGTAVSPTLP